jgi:hypothetical protein
MTGIKKRYFNNYVSRELIDIAFEIESIQKKAIDENQINTLEKLKELEGLTSEIKNVLNILKKGNN